MGHTGPLPERVLRLIPKAQRAAMGSAGETIDEATARASVKLEREMHDQFSAWLRINGIPFIHARTDLRSTIQKGWPDFTVLWRGGAVCIEFKMPKGIISEEQRETMKRLQETGSIVVIFTNSQEAIHLVKSHFKL